MKKAYFHERTGRFHELETGNLVAKARLAEYEIMPRSRRVSARAGAAPEVVPVEPVQPANTNAVEGAPAPVMMPSFSELDAAAANDNDVTEDESPADRPEGLPGTTDDCPSCGVSPRVCPEGHTYYEGMSHEECGELVDLWEVTCQAIGSAKGRRPVPIPTKLRDRFAKVLQRQSRHYRPMPAKVEIPLLLVATASACTVPGDGAAAQTAEQPEESEASPAAESNGSSKVHRRTRTGGMSVDL